MPRAGAQAPFYHSGGDGAAQTLDMPPGSRLIWHAVGKIDGHLGVDHAPILPPTGPLFRNIHHRQIQHLEHAVIGGEHRFCLGHFAKLTVEAFNGIGGIDEPAYLLRILEVSVLATLKRTRKNRTGGKIEEEKEKKENGKEGTQIYSGIQGTDGGAI